MDNDRMLAFLKAEGVSESLLDGVRDYRKQFPVPEKYVSRVPAADYLYYGKDVWEAALSALLCGKNLLLAGPKATGKNVFAENLAAAFGRPCWNVSFHVGADAAYLLGTDTFNGDKVVFRPGPITLCAEHGGFAVLDEINMAKNEALAVLHSTLDHRRAIDLSGYDRIAIHPAARFIGTMNYGYAGTRELNEALCSRFAVLEMPVISEADLLRLIGSRYPHMKEELRGQFARLFFELDKKASSAEISDRALDLRGLLDAIGMMEMGTLSGAALDMCITNKTFDVYERKLIRDVITARIPADMRRDMIFTDSHA